MDHILISETLALNFFGLKLSEAHEHFKILPVSKSS